IRIDVLEFPSCPDMRIWIPARSELAFDRIFEETVRIIPLPSDARFRKIRLQLSAVFCRNIDSKFLIGRFVPDEDFRIVETKPFCNRMTDPPGLVIQISMHRNEIYIIFDQTADDCSGPSFCNT